MAILSISFMTWIFLRMEGKTHGDQNHITKYYGIAMHFYRGHIEGSFIMLKNTVKDPINNFLGGIKHVWKS